MTNRLDYYKRHKLKNGEPLSLSKISKISGVPTKILQQVYNRGVGAHKTNPQSVRLKGSFKKNSNAPLKMKLSKEQWAMARVYSFVNKIEGFKKLNHDHDLCKLIPRVNARNC